LELTGGKGDLSIAFFYMGSVVLRYYLIAVYLRGSVPGYQKGV